MDEDQAQAGWPVNYILKDKQPVPEPDIIAWAKWFGTNKRHVAQDNVGESHVSTVFLGVDHNFIGGRPVLFETMIFGGEHDQEQERYCTWDEAEAGHARWVKRLSS